MVGYCRRELDSAFLEQVEEKITAEWMPRSRVLVGSMFSSKAKLEKYAEEARR